MALIFSSRFSRLLRHWRTDAEDVRRHFGAQGFASIEQAIFQCEKRSSAELRFAIESSLDAYQIWAEVRPRARAETLFAKHRVWDTEDNNGVLIYLLMADRAVEVIVDREAQRRVSPLVWKNVCDVMTQAFGQGQYVDGVLKAIALLQPTLEAAFPRLSGDVDELPNAVLID